MPTSWKTNLPQVNRKDRGISHLSPIKKRQKKGGGGGVKNEDINSHSISLKSSSHSSSATSSLNYQDVDIFKHVFQSSSCSQFLYCSFLRHFEHQLLNSYFF